MVSFSIISDLHLSPDSNVNWRNLVNESADYLILAGDIGNIQLSSGKLLEFIESICKESSYKKIIFIFGNHEFYNPNGYTYQGLLATFRLQTATFSKFVILQNEYIDIEQNLRIFGATLWTKVPETTFLTYPIYNELKVPITTNWLHREYYHTLECLDSVMSAAKRLIVVTHYAPTFHKTLKVEDYTSPHRFLYCSELDRYLTKEKVYTWFFGHTHVNVDYLTTNDTRLVTNQYRGDSFNSLKIVHIKDEISAKRSSMFSERSECNFSGFE